MKLIKRYFNLRFLSKEAKFENPSIGPLLSPHIQRPLINQICADFNNKTNHLKSGLEVYLTLIVYKDNSFMYVLKGIKPTFLLNLINTKTYEYLFLIYYFNFFIIKNLNNTLKESNSNVDKICKLNFKSMLNGVNINFLELKHE